jgi:hypothetical protein
MAYDIHIKEYIAVGSTKVDFNSCIGYGNDYVIIFNIRNGYHIIIVINLGKRQQFVSVGALPKLNLALCTQYPCFRNLFKPIVVKNEEILCVVALALAYRE